MLFKARGRKKMIGSNWLLREENQCRMRGIETSKANTVLKALAVKFNQFDLSDFCSH